ncbi:MAG: hypothetical protein SOU49_05685 [Sodaliphilus pleomorphus]|uniref:hypothetical protein n=1 Tax=Sodaliphilus pleomorphus TaxID=2606626 RepID=UPI002A74EA09|nr:hypothetical protein [Sodaliphilus pleomorphus]MDY2832221.1 hypothetical protein [Sodaliphilus pleomorphus]
MEGRSEQNFDVTFDDVYINELELGTPTGCDGSTPTNAWTPQLNGMKCVALPWVNDYSGNIQNLADFHPEERNSNGTLKSNAYYSWNAYCQSRSWQPYLLYITKKICEAVGYAGDFSKWEKKEEYRYLLICNTLPYAWNMPEFARALPHWTVAEFFEKLEPFLEAEFEIDHHSRHIGFAYTKNILAALPQVAIDKVIDEHTVEVTVEDDNCEYREAKILVYAECDHEMWKFYSCDWFIKSWGSGAVQYDTLNALLAANKSYATWDGTSERGSRIGKLLYAKDLDIYFVIRAVEKTLVEERDWLPNRYSYKCICPHTTLRLNNKILNKYRKVYQVNPKQKATFKFLSDTIPNPRSLFIIRGKRYVCEKLTATFTSQGMSQLIKGSFYTVLGT